MPPAGYYRKFLPNHLSFIRLAKTSQPIVGMAIRRDLLDELIRLFGSSDDQFAPYYVDSLKSGAIVPVEYADQKVWAPGELFFRS